MSLTYNYVVTLRNDRIRPVNTTGFLLCLIAVIYFGQHLLSGTLNLIQLGGFIIVTGGLIWNILAAGRWPKRVVYSPFLLVAGLVWYMTAARGWLPYLGVLFVLLGLLEKQAKLPLEIGFSDDEIVINALIRRRFHWKEFSNIMLRDGLLTMDFKSNRLFQKQIIDDDDDADEEEFNAYCQYHLRQNA